MVENKILLNVDEKIAYNCLIFTKSAYSSYLEIKLNDKAFLESISNDSYQNQLSDLEMVEKEFSISLENGKNYLNKLIQEQGNKEKLEEYENTIEALNSEFHNERSGDKIKSINDKIEGIYDDVISIDKEGLSDELYQKLSGIINRCKTIKDELKGFLDNYVSDEQYEKNALGLFNSSRLWQSAYGNYNYNPYLKTKKDKEDKDIKYEKLVDCKALIEQKYQNPLFRVFVPLSFLEYLFISKDGRSITCLDREKKEVFTCSMEDDIIASGAIMFFKEKYYLIIPCKNSIKIIGREGIIKSFPYNFPIQNMLVKSITVYNQSAYILIDDIDNNQTIVDFIRYDFYTKEFKNTKQLRMRERVLSNIFIIKDFDKEQTCAGYIEENHELHIVDLDSFDPILEFDVEYAPIDGYCSILAPDRKIEFMYNYPIISFDGCLYYLGYSKRDELFLEIVTPFGGKKESSYVMPKYQVRSNDKGFMLAFTNIAVSLDKVYFSGIKARKILEFDLNGRNMREKDVSPHKGYNFLVAYENGAYVLNNQNNEVYLNRSIVAIWNGHLVMREPNDEGYTLYVES